MLATEIPGRTRFEAGECLPMHRHADAYAAVIIEGSYDEFGFDGRYVCQAGDVVLHPRVHAHGNAFPQGRARVVNIPLPGMLADAHGLKVFNAPDVRSLLALAAHNPVKAGHALIEEGAGRPPLAPPSWLTGFTLRLLAGASVAASARQAGCSPEHASRTCRSWFGLSPLALRREARMRAAIAALRDGAKISEAAQIGEFSDQPHLTRVLRHQTGLTPAGFRGH
ncbi:hypothetical protein AWH62_02235 [Maricaulis sp. W15]|uniref:helix-turn-helix domain-containing protein n=1 Tax=Maricaulis sp. W15 TaxID=1772333 RepID=UPI000948CE97|nr:helix-turn-helix transcriptional regulator [Maricaulis sp. W15]OLF81511.1 hypothetical protein AWH62_02235 [Maricaulis sp. W15]